MFFNSGTLLSIYILGGSFFLLLLFLIILAGVNKKNQKSKALKPLKVTSFIFVLLTVVSIAIVPLTYYNYIPLNLCYGKFFSPKDSGSNVIMVVKRDAIGIDADGDGNVEGTATWSLEKNVLTLTFPDDSKQTLTVKSFGQKLYDGNTLVLQYDLMKNLFPFIQ